MTAVVLLHAITRDRADFGALLTALPHTAAEPRDLLGHGAAPRAERYRIVDYAASVPLPAGRCVLYGHSLGGMVALAIAAAAPGRVAGLVLEDPPLFESRGERMAQSAFQRGFASLKRLMTGEAAGWTIADWERAVEGWPSGHGRRTMAEVFGPEGVRRRARQLAGFDSAALEPTLDGTLNDGFEVIPALRTVRCPVVLVHGERERGSALAPEDVQLLAAEPNVSVVPVAGEGHFIHETLPGPCAAAVRALLA